MLLREAVHSPLQVHPAGEGPEADDRPEVRSVSEERDQVAVWLPEPYLEEQADYKRSRVVLRWLSPLGRVGFPRCLSRIDEDSRQPDELSVFLLLPVLVVAPLTLGYHGSRGRFHGEENTNQAVLMECSRLVCQSPRSQKG